MEMDWPTLSAIGVTASGIFAVAWKQLRAAIKYVHAEVMAKIEECETDRKNLRDNQEAIIRDMDLFKACEKDPCGAKAALQRRRAFDTTPK
jgi:hypothetical protein